jgi:toxin YhaV
MTRPEYRQCATLGDDHKHWLRAKFFQQYRLFFRYHAASKLIVFAWVNDEDCKRAYGSSDDAYRVFRKMLEGGLARTKSPHLLVDHGDELVIVRRRSISSMGIPSLLAQLVMSSQSTSWLRHTRTA